MQQQIQEEGLFPRLAKGVDNLCAAPARIAAMDTTLRVLQAAEAAARARAERAEASLLRLDARTAALRSLLGASLMVQLAAGGGLGRGGARAAALAAAALLGARGLFAEW